MKLFENWIESIRRQRAWALDKGVRASAVYKAHRAVMHYASVDVRIEPAAELELCDSLDAAKRARLTAEKGGEATLFGVLDVFVLRPATPILPFRLTIEDIDFHEIDSRAYAFRMAGRRAAEKCLEMLNSLNR